MLWKFEKAKKGRPTKVPYQPSGVKARQVDFSAELFFQGTAVLVQTVDLRQIVAMLVPPWAFVARVTLAFLPKRLCLGCGLSNVAIQGKNASGGAFFLDRAVLRRHDIEIG